MCWLWLKAKDAMIPKCKYFKYPNDLCFTKIKKSTTFYGKCHIGAASYVVVPVS